MGDSDCYNNWMCSGILAVCSNLLCLWAGGDALLADLGAVLRARAACVAPGLAAPAGLAVRTARRLLALACDAVRHPPTPLMAGGAQRAYVLNISSISGSSVLCDSFDSIPCAHQLPISRDAMRCNAQRCAPWNDSP